MDIELGDGSSTRPFPPTAWELRRRAAQQAVDEARLTRNVLVRPATAAETSIAQELYRRIAALQAVWDARDQLPPLAHRLRLLVEVGQLVRPLVDPDTGSGDVEQHLREALEAVTVMCTAFGTRLTTLEDHLRRRSAGGRDSWEDLAQFEQELHPAGGTEGTCRWDAQGAMEVLSQMREGLLAPLLAS